MEVGETATLTREITGHDVEAFAKLSLDRNRVHFDEAFAAETAFGKPIAHGLIGASIISGGLTALMGDGNVWLSADLTFESPAYVGDELTAILEISAIERRVIAVVDARIINQHKQVIVSGTLRSMRFTA